jgi:hypothetical protein
MPSRFSFYILFRIFNQRSQNLLHHEKLLLALLFVPVYAMSQGTVQLYGLYLGTNSSLNSNVGVCTINPATAQASYLNAFPNTDIHAFGDHTVDALHHQFFQVTGDSVNMYLMNFNITTGALSNILYTVDSVGNGAPGTVTIGGNIQGTFYNCADDMVYFFHFKAPWEPYMHFAKVNHYTGDVTELDSFQLGINVIDNLTVPTHQVAYWLQYNYSSASMNQLVSYDLVNLQADTVILSTPVIPTGFWVLTFNPLDGMLYGLQEDLDSFSVNNYLADLRFIKVDPLTGVVEDLTTDFLGNIIASNLAMDFSANKLNVVIQTQNPGYPQLCNYDLNTGFSLIQNISYTNFGVIQPSLIGTDAFLVSKDCAVPTGEEALMAECFEGIRQLFGAADATIDLGCYWKDYLGMDLMLFDALGRKISTQHIDDHLAVINAGHQPPEYTCMQ